MQLTKSERWITFRTKASYGQETAINVFGRRHLTVPNATRVSWGIGDVPNACQGQQSFLTKYFISNYCMKPSKDKVPKCALYSILCTVCYIFPLILIKFKCPSIMLQNNSQANYTHRTKLHTQNSYFSEMLIVQLEKLPEKLCGVTDCFSSKGMATLDSQFSFSQYSISCLV